VTSETGRGRGRPRRPLPEGIGQVCDEAVAALARERGERLSAGAVKQLRRRRGIAAAEGKRGGDDG
jgi:hypothetical protein